jgi:hypothetical protein
MLPDPIPGIIRSRDETCFTRPRRGRGKKPGVIVETRKAAAIGRKEYQNRKRYTSLQQRLRIEAGTRLTKVQLVTLINLPLSSPAVQALNFSEIYLNRQNVFSRHSGESRKAELNVINQVFSISSGQWLSPG